MTAEPNFGIENDHDLAQHRRSWTSLALLTMALGIASAYRLGWLALAYTGHRPNLGAFVGWEKLDFWLQTLSIWPKLLAALVFLSVSNDIAWKRRGLFFLFCTMLDGALWTIEHAPELGLADESNPFPELLRRNDWMRYAMGTAIGWAEFPLMAGMIAATSEYYGNPMAPDFAKSIRALSRVGSFLWLIFFLNATRWGGPNGMELRRVTLDLFLFWQVVRIIWTICLVQTTMLAFDAFQRTGKTLSKAILDRKRTDEWPYQGNV